MNVMRAQPIVLAGMLALLFVLWARPSQAASPMQVTVSILPQAYFAKKIAKNLAKVSVMVPRGSSPATYEPRPSQMADLTRATLYFAIGVPFEAAWLHKFARMNPHMRIVHTDKGIQKRTLSTHLHQKTTDHPPSASSVLPGTDPHIWLSPHLVKKIARNMADGFTQADPEHRQQYENNLKSFEMELDRLDHRIRTMLNDGKRKRSVFLVFHPSWGYFADQYGLKQVPMEVEGKSPSAMEMVRLTRYAGEMGIERIFVQPQFSKKRVEAMARQMGASVVTADPLNEDWEKNLLHVARQFKQALD